MLAEKFHDTYGPDADYWGEHPRFTVDDWLYQVTNEDTRLGYWDWVEAHEEQDDTEEEE